MSHARLWLSCLRPSGTRVNQDKLGHQTLEDRDLLEGSELLQKLSSNFFRPPGRLPKRPGR